MSAFGYLLGVQLKCSCKCQLCNRHLCFSIFDSLVWNATAAFYGCAVLSSSVSAGWAMGISELAHQLYLHPLLQNNAPIFEVLILLTEKLR